VELINEFVKIQHWHLPNSKIKRKKHNEKVIFYTIAQNVTRKNLKEMFECYLEEFTINKSFLETLGIIIVSNPLHTYHRRICEGDRYKICCHGACFGLVGQR